MKDFFQGFAGGIILASTVTLFTLANVGIIDEYHEKKVKCEQELPRNQVCVMKLVPQGDK